MSRFRISTVKLAVRMHSNVKRVRLDQNWSPDTKSRIESSILCLAPFICKCTFNRLNIFNILATFFHIIIVTK